MVSNKPLLSIAIPTKNRQIYCTEVIKHILTYDDSCFELVVHDHSDDNLLEEYIRPIKDTRLKYFYTTDAISSSENMSRAVEMTAGEYVCMIGDDDTILPSIFDWVKYMKRNGIDSICPSHRPEYYWPNEETGNTGTLKIVKLKRLAKIQNANSVKSLNRLFANGIIQYPQYHLPGAYHCLIRKELLDKIYAKVGTYFRGLSPDIYAAVALSCLVQSHFITRQPITVAGACPLSTTSQGRHKELDGPLSNAPHFKNNTKYNWDIAIPRYYCGETIWAESALKAARDFSNHALLEAFNVKAFSCASLLNNLHIKRIVFEEHFKCYALKDNFLNRALYIIYTCNYTIISFTRRFLIKVFCKTTVQYTKVVNIAEAESLVLAGMHK